MDSSQPGYVSCIIPRDIYSDNGRVVLLEKGTRVLGEYQTGVQRGKYRLFAVWNRAVTPRGVAIDVGSPASDALGRSGMAGGVKNFFWERFGAALLFSSLNDAASIAASKSPTPIMSRGFPARRQTRSCGIRCRFSRCFVSTRARKWGSWSRATSISPTSMAFGFGAANEQYGCPRKRLAAAAPSARA